ncbi:MAG: 16S rRNA processing protein RimM [Bacteroidetes bacterium]|nr:MAG: 16S rRNA processing protein RimM [Bacteroidota bacterium]
MEKEQCYDLGFVSKTQGYKGTLILHLEVDFPESYSNLESVYVQKNNKLIPFFIKDITILHKGFARVNFEDINNEEDARALIKCKLYLPIETLPELDADQFYYHEIIGFAVIDNALGEIGTVVEHIDIPGNPQLVVLHQEKEVFIPISDTFYRGINKIKKEIFVTLPEGLIEANL